MSDRVTVNADALSRLIRATIATEQRSRTTNPELRTALTELLGTSEPAAPDRDALTVAEAADRLGVSERTIRRRVADGSIPHRRLGRRILIDPRAVMSRQDRSGPDNPVDSRTDDHHGHPT